MKAFVTPFLMAWAFGAQAHDALLQQALSRKSLPTSELRGSVRITTTRQGGKKPEVEARTVNLEKSPGEALAPYNEVMEVIGQDAYAVERHAGRTIYAFTTDRLPRGGTVYDRVNADGGRAGQVFEGQAELSLDAKGRPYVSRLDLQLPHAEGTVLARIKKIDVSYAFAPGATEDHMVTTAVSVEVDVRSLFFIHRNVRTDSVLVTETSNL